MLGDLLANAREQAERSNPPVRAAALLHVARVEAAVDVGAARKTFDRASEAIGRLSDPDKKLLVEQAGLVAAAVDPELLGQRPELSLPRLFEWTLLEVMLDHEHVEQAASYLLHRDDAPDFPFPTAQTLIRRVGDKDVKIALVRRAIEVWRQGLADDPVRPSDGQFVDLFQSEWKDLPPEEALSIVREIVRVTNAQPEQPFTATYGDGAVQFTSWRTHVFFQLLHILQELDPELAESLIAEHGQLAIAARRFPKGRKSVDEEAEKRIRERPPGEKGGYMVMGSPEDFPFLDSLHQARMDGDFGPAFRCAFEKYRRDSDPANPNRAPREFWPSTCDYRSVLYHAGRQLGYGASVYLQHVPDDELRLFAQVELAAALAGLPPFPRMQRRVGNVS